MKDRTAVKKKSKYRRARIWIFVSIMLLAAVLIWFGFYSSRHFLTVSHYTVDTDSAPDSTDTHLCIVQLSDLHNSVFGDGNSRLFEKVAAEGPDLILVTGDLLNMDDPRTDIAEELIRGLARIAPVYVSMGNHELAHEQNYGTDLRKLYTEAGAAVLEYDYIETEVKGRRLRIGGLYGYCVPPDGNVRWRRQIDFLTAFQDTDRTTILLSHLPVSWLNRSLDAYDIDVVFAGHAHGGQIRIPFIGGLWAPDQGWFPGRECGLYYAKDGSSVLVLTRGLGSNEKIPRFNNIPEIVSVELL